MNAEIAAWLKHTEDQNHSGGITAIDLLALPLVLNRVMHIMLTKITISESALFAEVQKLPSNARLNQTDLHEALAALCERCWLVHSQSETGESTYRVNLRNRAATRSTARVWDVLDFDS